MEVTNFTAINNGDLNPKNPIEELKNYLKEITFYDFEVKNYDKKIIITHKLIGLDCTWRQKQKTINSKIYFNSDQTQKIIYLCEKIISWRIQNLLKIIRV